MTNEIWRWSASDMAAAIARREVSSVEVAESCLDRIDQVNGTLNALASVNRDETLDAARQADHRVAAGESLGPLHGVPIAIKINTDQAGHPTDDGVVAFADNVAEHDSPEVANIRSSGGVLLGRSNSPAFHFRWFSDNDLHGKTLNPWDAGRTPGGSSGGAASSVASGMVPLAQGNDIGGSIRHPAYACGVVGIRPTVGRVPNVSGPRHPGLPLSVQAMQVQGPLARTVQDVRLALDAMSGFSSRDPVSLSVPKVAETPASAGALKVGVLREGNIATPHAAVAEAIGSTAELLSDAGYIVEEVKLPMVEEAYRVWCLVVMEEFRQVMPLVEKYGDVGMKAAAATFYRAAAEYWGPSPTLDDFIKGYARRGALIADLQELMEEYPVILMPVSSEQAFEHDADISSEQRGVEVVHAQWSMMSVPLLGFPAMSVPTGVSNGLPTGVQLLGRRFGERDILDAAAVIEAQLGTFTPIDPRS